MTFGEKLKNLRKERSMSQEQLAKLLGTSKQVISRYETNQRTPKLTVAGEYADKLGVPLNYLVDNNYSEANEHPALDAQDALEIYGKLIEINNGNELTENQKAKLIEFFKSNSDYIRFTLNEGE